MVSDRISRSLLAFLVVLLNGCASVPEPVERHAERVEPVELTEQVEPVELVKPVKPPDLVAIPDPISPPEFPRVSIPEPAPARAGLSPGTEQIPALMRYLRAFPNRRTPYPPELDPVIREYLHPVDTEGIVLTIEPWHESGTGAYYGRVDISVMPVEAFAPYVPAITVHGPTVSSRISAIDAELNSLFSFPLPVLREAAEHVRYATEELIRARGIPYEVPPMVSTRVRDVFLSLGNPDEGEKIWWFHLPPRELERVLRERMPSEVRSVDVEESNRMVVIQYK